MIAAVDSDFRSTQVDPGSIGSALEKARKAAITGKSDNQGEESKPNKAGIRATLSNMIILVRGKCEEGLIEKLAENHPSRFFVIEYHNSLGEPLSTNVARRTVKGASGLLIQTEEIHIRVTPDSVKLVKNLILSHLVPDIETITLAIGKPSVDSRETLLRDDLISISDTFMGSVLDTIERPSENSSLNSVRYSALFSPRISKWRSLIAEQFDSEEARKNLSALSSICITYCEESANILPEEALLIASWILDSLKISPKEKLAGEDGKIIIKCRGLNESASKSAALPNETMLTFKASENNALSHISGVSFEMKNAKDVSSDGVSYVLNCSYLNNISAIEISSGGVGESKDSSSEVAASSGDVCEFYVRRIPTHQICIAESAIELIRGRGGVASLNELEVLRDLISVLNKNL